MELCTDVCVCCRSSQAVVRVPSGIDENRSTLDALEEKPRARQGNLEMQHNPLSHGEKSGLTCNTGMGMPTKSTSSGIILVYSLFQGVVLYLKWTNQRKGTKINRLC